MINQVFLEHLLTEWEPDYSPANDPTLLYWLSAVGPRWQDNARTVPAVASNDFVRVWDDEGPSGLHANSGDDVARPTIGTVAQNGIFGLHYSTSADRLISALPLVGDGITAVVVARVDVIQTNRRIISIPEVAGGDTSPGGWILISTNETQNGIPSPNVSTFRSGWSATRPIPVGTTCLIVGKVNGAATTISVDGNESSGSNSGGLNSESIRIGCNTSGENHIGEIFEVAIFQGQTAPGLAAYISYLNGLLVLGL